MASDSSDIGETRNTCVNSEPCVHGPPPRLLIGSALVSKVIYIRSRKGLRDSHHQKVTARTAGKTERHDERQLAIHDTQQGSIPRTGESSVARTGRINRALAGSPSCRHPHLPPVLLCGPRSWEHCQVCGILHGACC